jgi:hypothetical protein
MPIENDIDGTDMTGIEAVAALPAGPFIVSTTSSPGTAAVAAGVLSCG